MCVLWLLHDICSFVTVVKRMHRCVLGSCRQIEKNLIFCLFWLCVEIQKICKKKNKKRKENTTKHNFEEQV